MRVRWKGKFSSLNKIRSGIPQGSSSGPLIFGYFVSDLQLDQNHNSMLVKYADDFFLLGTITRTTTISPTSDAYDKIFEWTHKNKMIQRKEKCQQIFITASGKNDCSSFAVPDIPLKETLKVLGIFLDNQLKWKTHVNRICEKAASRMFVLRQLDAYVNPAELKIIY